MRDASIEIGVIGVNHKSASLQLRETLAQIFQNFFRVGSIHGEGLSFVLLSTCNRTELYFHTEDLAEGHSRLLKSLRRGMEEEFDHALYSFFGAECFFHLARVTAGLDSAILGETEIQGQVKKAYDEYAGNALHRALHFAFQKSLKTGKQVRSTLPLDRGSSTLEETVVKTGLRFFSQDQKQRVLVVGASQINEKILGRFRYWDCFDVSVCNRTLATGKKLAKETGCRAVPWSTLESWEEYPWLVVGTKCPDFLLKKAISRRHSRQLIIDLSMPRNVHPLLGRQEHITLLNIDQIQRIVSRRQRRVEAAADMAEGIVRSTVDRQLHIFREKERERRRYLARSV